MHARVDSAARLPLRVATALGLALALAAPVASATVYKCLLDNGGVFYQDVPCASGRELRDFDKDPANVSVMPFETPAAAPPQDAGASRRSGAKPKAAAPRSASVPKPESKSAKKSAERGDAKQRKFLRPGMSEGEVVARVGPPDMTSSGGSRKGARWTYMPVAEDPDTITHLQFDNGRVVEVERKVLR